jgi:prophage regulatory protein
MAEAQPTAGPGRLLKMRDVERETSLHRATIYRRIQDGSFPRPIRLGAQRVAWPERAVQAWVQQQLEHTPS